MNLGGMEEIHHLPCLVQDDSHFHPLLMVDPQTLTVPAIENTAQSKCRWYLPTISLSQGIPHEYHGISHDLPHQKARDLPLKVTGESQRVIPLNPRFSQSLSHFENIPLNHHSPIIFEEWLLIYPIIFPVKIIILPSSSHQSPISLYHSNISWESGMACRKFATSW